MAIELQGFNPVHENQVYSREGQFQGIDVDLIFLQKTEWFSISRHWLEIGCKLLHW